MAGKFPETRHFRYWQVQAAAGKLRVVLPPGTMNLQAWLMKPATLQKRAWDLHRSLVVTSILRCGRSISSQSSSSPQKIKQVSQHALEIHHLFSGIQKTEAPYTRCQKGGCRSNLWSMRCQHALWSLSLKDVTLTSTSMRGRKTTWFVRAYQYISICKTPQSCGGIFSFTHPWIWG